MYIYLLRHAVSIAREKGQRQYPEVELSPTGKHQAELASQRLKEEKIDIILSSKWTRARQTAEIVANKLNQPLELFEGIHEKDKPSELYGIEEGNQADLQYKQAKEKNKTNMDWKFNNQEESLREVVNRVIKFRDHLKTKHLNQNILVVSHGIFLESLISLCLLGANYRDQDFLRIFQSLYLENTGITLLEFDENQSTWKLRYLNDHMHLRKARPS